MEKNCQQLYNYQVGVGALGDDQERSRVCLTPILCYKCGTGHPGLGIWIKIFCSLPQGREMKAAEINGGT